MSAQLREASSVILLRRMRTADGGGFEVFLVRRCKGASFMASSFVFPGGAADPGEDARTTAVRELFEEACILLAKTVPVEDQEPGETLEVPNLSYIRKQLLETGDSSAMLKSLGLRWSTDVLVPWSHWITPSVEAKRFSARFFVCELPPGQQPKFDDVETVEQIWIKPADAIARAKELALPPPQVRTCWELAEHATIESVLAAGRQRAEEPHPIMPRLSPGANGPCLLLPWDPDYTVTGTGDSSPLQYRPAWACGPSRFVMEDSAWKHVAAPNSTSAG